MTTFNDREKGFENKFAHDEEMQFKAVAAAQPLLGLWAASLLGKTGDDADGLCDGGGEVRLRRGRRTTTSSASSSPTSAIAPTRRRSARRWSSSSTVAKAQVIDESPALSAQARYRDGAPTSASSFSAKGIPA